MWRAVLRLHLSLTLALDGGERVVSLAVGSFDLLGNYCVGLRLLEQCPVCSLAVSPHSSEPANSVETLLASSAR